MKRVCVIGAGFGGLALAIRLQSAGIETTIVEARDKPGGCAYFWERDDFTFDAGPSVFTAPDSLAELWALSGRDMADDVTLLPIAPMFRLNWPDGGNFTYSNDDAALRREIAQISAEDLAGYDEFLEYSAAVGKDVRQKLAGAPFQDMASMARALPVMARYQGWRSAYAIAASFMKNEKLREAFSFQTLLSGGNPMTASGLSAYVHKVEMDTGLWWPKGGVNRLVAAMAQLFEQLGGRLQLHDPAARIETLGDRVTEVECASGWRERFDAIASNADIMHSYRDLLAGGARGPEMARKLSTKRYAPSMFVVHFGLEGAWPGIPHHSVLFGPRFKGLFEDVFEYGVLPRDFAVYLHHPTVTDPSLAPAGKSVFSAMIPVAHLGKLPIDWEQIGPLLERRILDEIGLRLIPDIHDRIVTKFHYAPRDFAMDLNAYHGGAFSLEATLAQSAWLRPHNRDDKLRNFYLVGAGTQPGAGVANVVASARTTAKLMLEDLR